MKIQFLIYFLIIVNSCYSQKAMTFERAREKGIRSTALDSLYKSGIHADTSLAVFKTNQEEYITAYQQLLGNLGKFLKANNFIWEKPVKGFNRIYFDSTGKIDYFIYS